MSSFFRGLEEHYRKHPNTWYLAIALFAFIVYHYRLGYIAMRADEPTRTVVALEMMFSGNYWVPTINADMYYRKPPLYNWILVALMQITGDKSDFLLRLPSTVPLFLFGYTIFKHSKRYLPHLVAFLAAAMFVTCGRMLIYASLLGHIDIFYSWITYLGFIILFEKAKQGKWLQALMFSYCIHALGFLCKGLPSVLFAGLSAIPVILYFTNWKQVFGWRHLLSFAVFVIIIGAYFFQYSQYNAIDGWVNQLWDQSAQRTVLDEENAWYTGLLNLVKFPADHLMHLAPWSLFFPLLFFKGFKSQWKQSTFLKVFGLLFLVNIPIYWVSPGYYPRYLFMLYPIVFIFTAYALYTFREHKYVSLVFKGLVPVIFLLALAPSAVFFVDFDFEFVGIKFLIATVLGLLVFVAYVKSADMRWFYFIAAILVLRLSFNFFVLEHRKANGNPDLFKRGAIAAAAISKEGPLHLYTNVVVDHETTFYIERAREEILSYEGVITPGHFYILDDYHLDAWPKDKPFKDVHEFRVRFLHGKRIVRQAL